MPSLLCAFILSCSTTVSASPRDDDQIPENLRGTWVLRLYSDDGGKNYKSGGNQPVCEVSAKEIKFLKKIDFADEKLVLKSVTKIGQGNDAGHALYFANGTFWRVTQLSGSINVLIGKEESGTFKETHRITVRKK
jgi:hypothetical protein